MAPERRDGAAQWPTDKLTALRLGQRLVAEVPASRPGRRAFVDIVPRTTEADGQGWKRIDRVRAFAVRYWDYDADQLEGFDYDLGATRLRAATAANEQELAALLEAWDLSPGAFQYPWQTDDPQ